MSASVPATPRSSATRAGGSPTRRSRRWCSAPTCSMSAGPGRAAHPVRDDGQHPAGAAATGSASPPAPTRLAVVQRGRGPARRARGGRAAGAGPPADPGVGRRRRIHVRRGHGPAGAEVLSVAMPTLAGVGGTRASMWLAAAWPSDARRVLRRRLPRRPTVDTAPRPPSPSPPRHPTRPRPRSPAPGEDRPTARSARFRDPGARRSRRRRVGGRRPGNPAEGLVGPPGSSSWPTATSARIRPGTRRCGPRCPGHCAAWSATTSPPAASSARCTATLADTFPAWRIVAPSPPRT